MITRNEQETRDFAVRCAQNAKNGAVLCLHGDLGAGKSVFARAFIRALCGDAAMEVPSPTFTLVQTYPFERAGRQETVWHFDLYRLCEPSEIYEIGWEEALSEDGIVLVEWPERLGRLLPQKRTDILITGAQGEPDTRLIRIEET